MTCVKKNMNSTLYLLSVFPDISIFLNFDKIFSSKRKPLYFARWRQKYIVMPVTICGKIFYNTDFAQFCQGLFLFVKTPKLAILQKENKWKFLNKQSLPLKSKIFSGVILQ